MSGLLYCRMALLQRHTLLLLPVPVCVQAHTQLIDCRRGAVKSSKHHQRIEQT